MSVSATPARRRVWAIPFSLAATNGIEVSLFSSGYLDVSVPQVRLHALCIQAWMIRRSGPGCPIRKSQDHSLVASFPGLIAGSNVLHRLWTPSHPPRALSSLTTPTSDRPINPFGANPFNVLRLIRAGTTRCVTINNAAIPMNRDKHLRCLTILARNKMQKP